MKQQHLPVAKSDISHLKGYFLTENISFNMQTLVVDLVEYPEYSYHTIEAMIESGNIISHHVRFFDTPYFRVHDEGFAYPYHIEDIAIPHEKICNNHLWRIEHSTYMAWCKSTSALFDDFSQDREYCHYLLISDPAILDVIAHKVEIESNVPNITL